MHSRLRICCCGCFPEIFQIENNNGDIIHSYCECKICEISTICDDLKEEKLYKAVMFWNEIIDFVKYDISQL